MTNPARETLLRNALTQCETALQIYGRHPSFCPKGVGIGLYQPPDDAVCRCGIDSALEAADAVRASLTEAPTETTGPKCIACGECNDGGYEVENGPGPFCAECWERLRKHFTADADMARLEDAAGAGLHEEARQRAAPTEERRTDDERNPNNDKRDAVPHERMAVNPDVSVDSVAAVVVAPPLVPVGGTDADETIVQFTIRPRLDEERWKALHVAAVAAGGVHWHINPPAVVPVGWQPLETAADDGTVVLGYGPKEGIALACYVRSAWPRGRLTHWMPLPEPPL